MKTIYRLLILFLFVPFASTAWAQSDDAAMMDEMQSEMTTSSMILEDDEVFPAVNVYVETPVEARNAAWWSEVESAISLENQDYRALSVEALQHVIHFQVHYGDKVDLRDSLPALLDTYHYHKSEPMRIMALAAIIEIGDEAAIEKAHQKLYQQRSERVKDFAVTALQAYYNS